MKLFVTKLTLQILIRKNYFIKVTLNFTERPLITLSPNNTNVLQSKETIVALATSAIPRLADILPSPPIDQLPAAEPLGLQAIPAS